MTSTDDTAGTTPPTPPATPSPADTVRAAIDAAKASKNPAPVYDAADAFARLSDAEFAKARAELVTWKGAEKVPLNFHDFGRAVKAAKLAARRELRAARRERRRASADRHRPEICITGRQLRDISDDAIRALHDANDPPELFMRSGEKVRIREDEHHRPIIDDGGIHFLKGRLERAADFYTTFGEGEQVIASPPMELCRDIDALDLNATLAQLGCRALPPLVGVVEAPMIRSDGSILSTPGYDRFSNLYLTKSELCSAYVPDEPTAADVEGAVERLREPFGDFPYADAASFANTLGAILTLFARWSFHGKVPLGVVDKPQPGTGGSLLVEGLAHLATASEAAMYGAPGDDDEFRKLITSVLYAGRPIAIIDNVEHPLESDAFARVLTCTEWGDRLLGHTREIRLPHRTLWFCTGNNILLGRNIARRCYHIRLDAQVPNPAQRSEASFRHPNLLEWIGENRLDLVESALTICRSWFMAGRPAATTPILGSFETWSRVIGGMLAHAGVTGFLGNLQTFQDAANEETGEWDAFLAAWKATYGARPIMLAQVERDLPQKADLRDALPAELSSLVEREPARGFSAETWRVHSRFKLKLGKALQKRAGMRFPGGLYFHRAADDSHSKVAQWECRDGVAGSAGSGGATFSPTCEEDAFISHEYSHTRKTHRGETPPQSPALPAELDFDANYEAEERAAMLDVRTH